MFEMITMFAVVLMGCFPSASFIGLVDLEHRQLRSNQLGVGRSQQGGDTVLAGRMASNDVLNPMV